MLSRMVDIFRLLKSRFGSNVDVKTMVCLVGGCSFGWKTLVKASLMEFTGCPRRMRWCLRSSNRCCVVLFSVTIRIIRFANDKAILSLVCLG